MGIGKSIKLQPLDTLLGNENVNGVTEIFISTLVDFEGHPFQVVNDEKMKDMIESIQEYGVLTPIIVRNKDDKYEIVSGHRRKFACQQLGISKIPAIIKELDDDAAAIMMVDSNIQREEILPSEKAFAYKIKLEAMKRQGERSDLTCTQVGHKLKDKKSVEILAEETQDSRNQIQRYIRLTYLIKALLEMVDNKELSFTTAVELSFLNETQQQMLHSIMSGYGKVPSLKQATKMKELSRDGKLDETTIELILDDEKKETKINITSKKIKKYFPEEYTAKQMEDVIYQLLEEWSKNAKK